MATDFSESFDGEDGFDASHTNRGESMTNAEHLRECATLLHAYESGSLSEDDIFDPIVAGLALADEYLAEHPADEDEAITDTWLREIGFSRFMQPAATNHLSIGDLDSTDNHLARWENPDGPHLWAINQQWTHNGPRTRGQLRTLCKAIGIELNEK